MLVSWAHYHCIDIAEVSKCSEKSVELNAIVNSKIESKKLQFNRKKCTKMHIGPWKESCHNLKVREKEMFSTDVQTYLGDTICSTGGNSLNTSWG